MVVTGEGTGEDIGTVDDAVLGWTGAGAASGYDRLSLVKLPAKDPM